MRWGTPPKKYKLKEVYIFERFAWLPCKVQGQWVWLEWFWRSKRFDPYMGSNPGLIYDDPQWYDVDEGFGKYTLDRIL